eukprot:TRINITY_DN455_c0_g1_i3.p1 TRINITY_DN455_c0_g1~~TRINITY_DN455_c0_g1_i3.p1  ORF type:complete len:402 (-),score=158.87 TRINITY_DN455_c0_g1_i3:90-1295(-)
MSIIVNNSSNNLLNNNNNSNNALITETITLELLTVPQIQQLIIDTLLNNMSLFSTLASTIDAADSGTLARILFELTYPKKTLALVNLMIENDFKQAENAGSTLRGNNATTRLMTLFARSASKSYLSTALKDILEELIREDLQLEVDPSKLAVPEKIEENQKKLIQVCQNILNSLTSFESVSKISREMRALGGLTAKYALIYCPSQKLALVGGLFMLRLVNPALATPNTYGIIPDSTVLNPGVRRTLILVSKILQALSNGIIFGNKEPFMKPFNEFLETNHEKMSNFLTEICVDPLTNEENESWIDLLTPSPAEFDATNLTIADFVALQRYFKLHKPHIMKTLKNQNVKKELLYRLFQELGAPLDNTTKVTGANRKSFLFIRISIAVLLIAFIITFLWNYYF